MNETAIARLLITLKDVKPPVTRRVEVPLTVRLDTLLLILQAAMGWDGGHLSEIRAGHQGWGITDPDWDEGPLDASKARLIDVLRDTGLKTLLYLYDYGDGWEHKVKLERIIEPVEGQLYPLLVDGSGACPPEDVGGPWGYAELLEARDDPDHERYDEYVEIYGDAEDPLEASLEYNMERVGNIAKSMAAKAQ
jgi:hypothetical protein